MCILPNYVETDLSKNKQRKQKETLEIFVSEQPLLKNST